MQFKKNWQSKKTIKKEVFECIIGALLMSGCLIIGSEHTREYTTEKSLALAEEAIRRAVVQCYAIEGIYPPDVEYIERRYGIPIDQEKYIVHYESFASNIMPDITVLRKK